MTLHADGADGVDGADGTDGAGTDVLRDKVVGTITLGRLEPRTRERGWPLGYLHRTVEAPGPVRRAIPVTDSAVRIRHAWRRCRFSGRTRPIPQGPE